MFDQFGYIQVDVQFINYANEEDLNPVKYDMICPLLKTNAIDNNVLNWSSKWCRVRILEKNRCSFRCPEAQKIKEMDDNDEKR